MDLKDKVALVTGSAGLGMGRSIALTLAREGAKVAVNYRTSNNQAQAIVNHIESHSDDAVAVEADVFKADDCKNLVDAVIDHFGRIDICIINPGAGWHPESIDKLDSTVAVEDVQHEVAPFFHLMPLVLPHMYERQWGRVIGIALLPPYDSPAYSYNVGKAARVHALLKARDEAWRHGVTVNVIAPGPVAAIESLSGAIEQCERGPAWRERRNTSPQDIAESVAFLCSDAGRFITGSSRDAYCPFCFIHREHHYDQRTVDKTYQRNGLSGR
ncbi:MAG: SDR family NAD(P)-dependent oxidoreductase [Planctomycetota bacterium]|jgi:NAD(P)-dependent dehydrogenase (short-subunit alcohol dehydrogenase family)